MRQLAGRGHVILDLHNGADRIDDAVIDNCVDLYRNVVAADHVLRRDVVNQRSHVDFAHLLDAGDQENKARARRFPADPAKKSSPSPVCSLLPNYAA